MAPIKLRAPMKDDSAFIYNSWLKSYRNSDFAKSQCNTVYYDNHKEVLTALLTRSLVVVACNPGDENHVFGYLVYEELAGNNTIVHYVYVKHTYRRSGIAKQMLDTVRKSKNPILVSHLTPICKATKSVVYIYDPYKMFENTYLGPT